MAAEREVLLEVKDLEVTYGSGRKAYKAVKNANFTIYKGETFGLVGESGSGKSVFTKNFVGMLDANGMITGGSIMYEGRDMTKFTEKDWLGVRGKKIAMVMQDPMTSLNPLKKIGKQIQESIEHHQGLKGEAAKKAAIEMLAKVGIPDPERRYEQYPHEFSGGMRQRVVIAIALSCDPDLLICDEPTTALDVTIQAKILELIRSIQKERGISVIYITHDLGVVAKVADYVDVMYAGKIVETGTIDEIFYDPRHPYTWGLLSAMPDLDRQDYVILNSTANVSKALDVMSPYERIHCLLDNDKAGFEATRAIELEYSYHVRDFSHNYRGYSDLNDYLCGRKQEQKNAASQVQETKQETGQRAAPRQKRGRDI